MRQLSPEEKREAICTLYEAIQLFQVSNFRFAVDLILIEESGMEWEHHRARLPCRKDQPGAAALRRPTGSTTFLGTTTKR